MSTKKEVRASFRNAVFAFARHRCQGPECPSPNVDASYILEAHHITDRNLLPSGGYVQSNGIALCPDCHEKAEVYHSTGEALPGWAPDDLYRRIGSSLAQATRDSLLLAKRR